MTDADGPSDAEAVAGGGGLDDGAGDTAPTCSLSTPPAAFLTGASLEKSMDSTVNLASPERLAPDDNAVSEVAETVPAG